MRESLPQGCGQPAREFSPPTRVVAEAETGAFDYEVTTVVGSGGKGEWTVFLEIEDPPSANLASDMTDPETIDMDDTEHGNDYEEVPTSCEGPLNVTTNPGTANLSAWDGSGCLDCFDTHPVDVEPSTGTCE